MNWTSVSHISPCATGINAKRAFGHGRTSPRLFWGSLLCFVLPKRCDPTPRQPGQREQGTAGSAPARRSRAKGQLLGAWFGAGLPAGARELLEPPLSSAARGREPLCRPDVSAREALAPNPVPCSVAQQVRRPCVAWILLGTGPSQHLEAEGGIAHSLRSVSAW